MLVLQLSQGALATKLLLHNCVPVFPAGGLGKSEYAKKDNDPYPPSRNHPLQEGTVLVLQLS